MSFKNYFTEKITTLATFSSLLLVTACGTYQQVDDSDGIYSSTSSSVEQETYVEANNASSTYYENYFKEKSSELELYSENEVFTDVDDYEGDYVENDSLEVERESYAGWGQETSNVSINVYGGVGFYDPFYSPFYYGYSPFWYGYGYYPYYGGFGFGYGYGYPGLYNPWYGGGFYGNYWNNYYYRNNVAFVNGRRGSSYYRSGRNSNSRYYDTSRIYNTEARRTNTSNRRNRSEATYSNTRNSRSTNGDVRTRTRTRVNTNANTPRVRTNNNNSRTRTRTNTQTRNNTYSTPRRSTSPTMSSGSSRGSSMRGGMRSSGGRRGGGI
ncbi:hypothetical protein SAMN04487989_105181 [Bizionia echini]|uniref:Vitellogenin II n=1 Tax=Bizionia echini TaxID=649333 RepID=A0A1I5CMZ9_9FLAO|nr:hypothetical protein [Bizionia echini]SFN88390.1 hypothetical protein SAMN04487989_105181 [Bizionia echini]